MATLKDWLYERIAEDRATDDFFQLGMKIVYGYNLPVNPVNYFGIPLAVQEPIPTDYENDTNERKTIKDSKLSCENTDKNEPVNESESENSNGSLESQNRSESDIDFVELLRNCSPISDVLSPQSDDSDISGDQFSVQSNSNAIQNNEPPAFSESRDGNESNKCNQSINDEIERDSNSVKAIFNDVVKGHSDSNYLKLYKPEQVLKNDENDSNENMVIISFEETTSASDVHEYSKTSCNISAVKETSVVSNTAAIEENPLIEIVTDRNEEFQNIHGRYETGKTVACDINVDLNQTELIGVQSSGKESVGFERKSKGLKTVGKRIIVSNDVKSFKKKRKDKLARSSSKLGKPSQNSSSSKYRQSNWPRKQQKKVEHDISIPCQSSDQTLSSTEKRKSSEEDTSTSSKKTKLISETELKDYSLKDIDAETKNVKDSGKTQENKERPLGSGMKKSSVKACRNSSEIRVQDALKKGIRMKDKVKNKHSETLPFKDDQKETNNAAKELKRKVAEDCDQFIKLGSKYKTTSAKMNYPDTSTPVKKARLSQDLFKGEKNRKSNLASKIISQQAIKSTKKTLVTSDKNVPESRKPKELHTNEDKSNARDSNESFLASRNAKQEQRILLQSDENVQKKTGINSTEEDRHAAPFLVEKDLYLNQTQNKSTENSTKDKSSLIEDSENMYTPSFRPYFRCRICNDLYFTSQERFDFHNKVTHDAKKITFSGDAKLTRVEVASPRLVANSECTSHDLWSESGTPEKVRHVLGSILGEDISRSGDSPEITKGCVKSGINTTFKRNDVDKESHSEKRFDEELDQSSTNKLLDNKSNEELENSVSSQEKQSEPKVNRNKIEMVMATKSRDLSCKINEKIIKEKHETAKKAIGDTHVDDQNETKKACASKQVMKSDMKGDEYAKKHKHFKPHVNQITNKNKGAKTPSVDKPIKRVTDENVKLNSETEIVTNKLLQSGSRSSQCDSSANNLLNETIDETIIQQKSDKNDGISTSNSEKMKSSHHVRLIRKLHSTERRKSLDSNSLSCAKNDGYVSSAGNKSKTSEITKTVIEQSAKVETNPNNSKSTNNVTVIPNEDNSHEKTKQYDGIHPREKQTLEPLDKNENASVHKRNGTIGNNDKSTQSKLESSNSDSNTIISNVAVTSQKSGNYVYGRVPTWNTAKLSPSQKSKSIDRSRVIERIRSSSDEQESGSKRQTFNAVMDMKKSTITQKSTHHIYESISGKETLNSSTAVPVISNSENNDRNSEQSKEILRLKEKPNADKENSNKNINSQDDNQLANTSPQNDSKSRRIISKTKEDQILTKDGDLLSGQERKEYFKSHKIDRGNFSSSKHRCENGELGLSAEKKMKRSQAKHYVSEQQVGHRRNKETPKSAKKEEPKETIFTDTNTRINVKRTGDKAKKTLIQSLFKVNDDPESDKDSLRVNLDSQSSEDCLDSDLEQIGDFSNLNEDNLNQQHEQMAKEVTNKSSIANRRDATVDKDGERNQNSSYRNRTLDGEYRQKDRYVVVHPESPRKHHRKIIYAEITERIDTKDRDSKNRETPDFYKEEVDKDRERKRNSSYDNKSPDGEYQRRDRNAVENPDSPRKHHLKILFEESNRPKERKRHDSRSNKSLDQGRNEEREPFISISEKSRDDKRARDNSYDDSESLLERERKRHCSSSSRNSDCAKEERKRHCSNNSRASSSAIENEKRLNDSNTSMHSEGSSDRKRHDSSSRGTDNSFGRIRHESASNRRRHDSASSIGSRSSRSSFGRIGDKDEHRNRYKYNKSPERHNTSPRDIHKTNRRRRSRSHSRERVDRKRRVDRKHVNSDEIRARDLSPDRSNSFSSSPRLFYKPGNSRGKIEDRRSVSRDFRGHRKPSFTRFSFSKYDKNIRYRFSKIDMASRRKERLIRIKKAEKQTDTSESETPNEAENISDKSSENTAICDRVSTSFQTEKNERVRNNSSENKQETHMCPKCKESFKTSYDCQKHLFNDHLAVFKCFLCRVGFATPDEYSCHLSERHDRKRSPQIDASDNESQESGEIKEPVEQSHEDMESDDRDTSQGDRSKEELLVDYHTFCRVCHTEYRTRRELVDHLWFRHKKRVFDSTPKKRPPPRKQGSGYDPSLTCRICHLRLRTKDELFKHLERKHNFHPKGPRGRQISLKGLQHL